MRRLLPLLPPLLVPLALRRSLGDGLPVGWRVDGLAAALLMLTMGLAAVVAVYARRNLGGQRGRRRFTALLGLTVVGLTLLAAGTTLLSIALGWTLSGHAAAELVAHADRPAARRAARRMHRAMLASDVPLWAAVAWAAVAGLPTQVGSAPVAGTAVAGTAVVAALLALAGIPRAALPPAHRWLPETAEAPSPVSALLHAGIVNGGGIVVLRLWPWFSADVPARLILAVAGGVAIAIGTWSAIVRRDVKGTLASSTSAQMGYLALECGAGLPAAALLHLLGHGCYKAWSFLRAGGAITRTRAHGVHAPALHRPRWAHLGPGIVPVLPVLAVGWHPAWPTVTLLLATLLVGLAAIPSTAPATTALVAGTAVATLLPLQAAMEGAFTATPWWAGLTIGAAALATTVIGAARLARAPEGRLATALRARITAPGVRAVPRLPLPPLGDPMTAESLVVLASTAVAPAWPLRAAVAANPLHGLEAMPFEVARAFAGDALGVRPHPPLATYLAMLDRGALTRADLAAVLGDDDLVDGLLARAAQVEPLFEPQFEPLFEPQFEPLSSTRPVAISADALEHAAMWCQAAWSEASTPGDPWAMWRRSLGATPEDPAAALAGLLAEVEDPDAHLRDLCVAAPGWVAHAGWRAEQEGTTAPLMQVLALRAALARALPGTTPVPVYAVHPDADVWQQAVERAHRRGLLARLGGAADPATPAAQVLACIDVRSERLRRALEAVGPYSTYGIAGFFGMVVRTVDAHGLAFDRCPVLVRPQRTHGATPVRTPLGASLRDMGDAVMHAPVTPLVGAEAAGLALAAVTLAELAAPRAMRRGARALGVVPDPWHTPRGVAAVQEAADAVESVLRGIGLVDHFAPVLLVVGHGASIMNNAYAAAYDCGACGGNSGHVNARLLVDALNDGAVRDALVQRGIRIPATTRAVAAVHDTTTDDVTIDPSAAADDLDVLRRDLADAGAVVRRERLAHLPGTQEVDVMRSSATRRVVQRRGADWSEPFPEWGLAGNASIIVAPRHLTRGVDLGGRSFLHSYEPSLDDDGSVLAGILTAPVVVAQWINAQYGWSTIDPERLGAGDKATHNAVGDIGVLSGAHGDLRIGLPWQSLFPADPRTGVEGMHDPLRLQVVVSAPIERIDRILAAHASIGRLVDHAWVVLMAIDPASGAARVRQPDGTWVAEGAQGPAVAFGRDRVHRRDAARHAVGRDRAARHA